jgi:4,5-DOPA dioxygenase extradiol
MTKQPALFLSHGSPMIVLDNSPARTFLEGLAGTLPTKPSAIIVISAHYDAPITSVTSGAHPPTIHDFGGFPAALYEMDYPAPGSPELAGRIKAILDSADIPNRLDNARGYDHGTWTPLLLAWPGADIPVVQISINVRATPQVHYNLGTELRALRDENILIIGSGSMTHNLSAFFRGNYGAKAPIEPWVSDFLNWLDAALVSGNHAAVLKAVIDAPHGTDNHPTMDHIMPLFVALGAGGPDGKAHKMHESVDHAVLAMDMWRFD